jgi:hypothetical protein
VDSAAANGAGLTVDGASATLLYTASTDSWNFNKQVIGQFTTANAQITGGSITGITGAASALVATNFSTANAQITGGSITGITGAASTLVATNFSTANAQITGGSLIGITAAASTLVATNFSTANAQITGGSITGFTGAVTTLVATNFSSANSEITGTGSHIGTNTDGSLSRVANVYAELGNFINFSSGNISITGGNIILGAGTAAKAPLQFSPGVNLSTAAAGAIEYDGQVFFTTPATSKRGLSPSTMRRFNNATVTINNATGVQSWLGTASGNLNVVASTTYYFEGAFRMSRTAGTTSHTVNLAFGGTATLTGIDYVVQATTSTGDVLAPVQTRFLATASSTAVTAASAVATENNVIKINGHVRINGAGTFIPQLAFSAAPGGAGTIAIGAWFKMTPIGVNNAAVLIGHWA